MNSLNRFLIAGLSVWALGCSQTMGGSTDDAAVDAAAVDVPSSVDVQSADVQAVDVRAADVTSVDVAATDTPPAQDVVTMRDASVSETACGMSVRLQGFGAFRLEYCAASDAARPVLDAGRVVDSGSGAPPPPPLDSGTADGSSEFLPPLRDSGPIEDTGAADGGERDPIDCRIDCAMACRDVVISMDGRYSRFWTSGTCARFDATRIQCSSDVDCP